jgi:hypothetical protein
MKKSNKDKWKMIGLVVLLLVLAPFLPEILLMADIVGLELAIAFLFYYLRSYWYLVLHFFRRLKTELVEVYWILVRCYLFRPKVYYSHVSVSLLILLVTGSTVVSMLIWAPAVLMSAGGLGPIA